MILRLIIAATLLASAAPADAARYWKCGDHPDVSVYDIRVKRTACEPGLAVAYEYGKRMWDGRSLRRVFGYRCSWRRTGYESSAVLCVRGRGKAVRFTFAV